MHRSRSAVVGLLALAAVAAHAADDGAEGAAPPPIDRAATSARVEAAIAAAGPRATLGTLRSAIDAAIAFGAPAYNGGDHAACADAYAETVSRLDRAFRGEDAATAAAHEALGVLVDAAERARADGADADGRAWALRCGFDQVSAACDATADLGTRLVGIAVEAQRRGRSRDALAAADAALQRLDELLAARPEAVPFALRLAPMVEAQALLADGRIVAASAALRRAVAISPELASPNLDLHRWWPPEASDAALAALARAVDAAPDDARLRFALGCEQRFSGDRGAGQASLRRALSLDPSCAEARRLVDGDADAVAPLP